MKSIQELYGEKNHLNLKLVVALSRTTSMLHRATQSELSPYNLTIAQFGVLEALYHLGDMKICEIIDKTLSTSGNMTVVINNLERDGLVSRYTSPEDRRVTKVSLTEKGAGIIADFFPEHVKHLEEQFSTLTASERQTLLKLLKKLNRLDNSEE